MRDFAYWRDELLAAKTIVVLDAVGKKLAEFQKQTDAFSGEVRLSDARVAQLREVFTSQRDKLRGVKKSPAPPPAQASKAPSNSSWRPGDEVYQAASAEVYVVVKGPSWHMDGLVQIRPKFQAKGLKPVREYIDPSKLTSAAAGPPRKKK